METQAITTAESAGLLESRPHFSLTMMGAVYVFLLISLVALMIGLFFAKAGAWPVLVYTLLVLMGLRLGFQHAWRQSGDYERLWFEQDDLRVEIRQSGVTTQHRFNRYWTEIKACADVPGNCSGFVLSSHGRHARLGRHMNSAERLDFARRLKQRLRQQNAG